MKAPFPYFGGKAKIAPVVWQRLGDVPVYVEPFFGSGAALLARPHTHRSSVETVNDADGMIANFWRALQAAPDEVARWADWPPNENDLHARHAWLVRQKFETDFVARLEGDPDWYDAKIAGWWVWGISNWIGSDWCTGVGGWQSVDGKLVRSAEGTGVQRQLLHLRNAGQGVKRQRLHLGDAGRGVRRKRISGAPPYGIMRKANRGGLPAYFAALASRLRDVRVACGDWTRVMGPSIIWGANERNPRLTGVFLDPPYPRTEREANIYAHESGVFEDVRAWAIQHGHNPYLRIALCGYEDGRPWPDGWTVYRWQAHGGMANQGNGRGRANKGRETVWFSPHCIGQTRQLGFGDMLFVNEDES